MAISISDINAQLSKLEAESAALRQQAEEIRNQERSAVIDELLRKIAEYDLSAADLKLSARLPGKRKAIASKAPAKYRGPNGETWSGGRGRKPGWVNAALAQGKSLSDFEV